MLAGVGSLSRGERAPCGPGKYCHSKFSRVARWRSVIRGEGTMVRCRAILDHSWSWQFGKILAQIYGTLLNHCYSVFGVVGQRLPSLTQDQRIHTLVLVRYLYGSWTHNLPHDPPHTCGTPDVVGVATGNDHTCRAGPTEPHYLTCCGSDAHCSDCRHGRDQPSLCV